MKGTSEAIAFLQKWQQKGPWNLTAILEGGPTPENKTFMPNEVRAMAEWINARNGKKNLYFTVNDTKSTQASKPKKIHMLRGRAFHVDIDPIKSADIGEEQRRIRSLIQEFPIAPTVVIFSGGGYQMFWKFKERVPLKNGAIEEIEETNKKIERLLVGTTQCWNIDRIMRLPGTMNIPNKTKRKAGRKPVMAKIVKANWGKAYTVKQFEDLPALPEGTAPWLGPLIITGERPDKDYPSRSEASMAAVGELKRSGMDKEDAWGIMTNTDFAISGHITDATNPERAFDRQWDKAEGPEGEDPEFPPEWDSLMFVEDQESFYDMTKKEDVWTSEKLFNNKFVAARTRGKDARTPVQNFLETRPDQCVHKMTWDPSLPHGRTERGTIWIWNTWLAPDWFGKEGDGNIEPWLLAMKTVYVEFWELAVKRIAYDIQYPEERPQWHLQAIGENGIGKSDCLYPVQRWADRYNLYVGVRNEMLKGQFNSFMSKKKVIIHNEPQGITDKIFNELKDMLAGNETKISIRALYKNPIDEAIIASWYFGGNKANGLSLTNVERRVFPVHSRAKTPKESTWLGEAVRRHKWIKKNWPQVVWYLRHKVKIDRDFGSVFPGVNKYQKQIASATGPLTFRLRPYIENVVKNRYVFTMGWVIDRLAIIDGLPIEDHRKDLSNKVIQGAFHEMGIAQCYRGEPVRTAQGIKRLWTYSPSLEKAGLEQLKNLWNLQDGEQKLEDETDETDGDEGG